MALRTSVLWAAAWIGMALLSCRLWYDPLPLDDIEPVTGDGGSGPADLDSSAPEADSGVIDVDSGPAPFDAGPLPTLTCGGSGIVVQRPEDAYLTLEAEIGSGAWTVLSRSGSETTSCGTVLLDGASNASCDAAIWTDGDGLEVPDLSPTTWLLRLETPGTYRLFVRYSMVGNGSPCDRYQGEDTFYVSPALNVDADVSTQVDLPDVGITFGDPSTEGSFVWFDTAVDYTVTLADTEAFFRAFSVARSEVGVALDRLALIDTTSGLGIGDLDRLPNTPVMP